MSQIRGKAIVVIEHRDKFLFAVCYEKEKDEVFYIPVGGGIEFGTKHQAACKTFASYKRYV